MWSKLHLSGVLCNQSYGGYYMTMIHVVILLQWLGARLKFTHVRPQDRNRVVAILATMAFKHVYHTADLQGVEEGYRREVGV